MTHENVLRVMVIASIILFLACLKIIYETLRDFENIDSLKERINKINNRFFYMQNFPREKSEAKGINRKVLYFEMYSVLLEEGICKFPLFKFCEFEGERFDEELVELFVEENQKNMDKIHAKYLDILDEYIQAERDNLPFDTTVLSQYEEWLKVLKKFQRQFEKKLEFHKVRVEEDLT